jgi:NAD+ synthase
METTSGKAGDLLLNTAFVRKILVEFLRDEVTKAGFRRCVVGLSGGVDSAVVAFLAAEALGAANVRGVMLPYRTSSATSIDHAVLVASASGIETETVDISPMVDAYLARMPGVERVRAGNIMARMRMVVLYDLSARDGALVLGTSNKTELLLGYGTQHGDLASAVNPLGDLFKTQVWQLASALGVPAPVVEKKPSADLWEGQTDEEEFGFGYSEADRLLFAMVDQRRTETELAAMGFEEGLVARIATMIRRSQFKRRPPIIAKVSTRTINVEFRYARDWGI